MTHQQIEKLLREHIALFNKHDWNKYKAGLAPDCIYEEEATGRKIVGAEHVVEAMRAWVAAFPDLRGEIVEAFFAGNKSVFQIVWKGTHKGSLGLPSTVIPPTGRYGELHAMEKFDVGKDGKVHAMQHYFDIMSLLIQMGIQPQLAAPSATH